MRLIVSLSAFFVKRWCSGVFVVCTVASAVAADVVSSCRRAHHITAHHKKAAKIRYDGDLCTFLWAIVAKWIDTVVLFQLTLYFRRLHLFCSYARKIDLILRAKHCYCCNRITRDIKGTVVEWASNGKQFIILVNPPHNLIHTIYEHFVNIYSIFHLEAVQNFQFLTKGYFRFDSRFINLSDWFDDPSIKRTNSWTQFNWSKNQQSIFGALQFIYFG